jgi:hypothetical protein
VLLGSKYVFHWRTDAIYRASPQINTRKVQLRNIDHQGDWRDLCDWHLAGCRVNWLSLLEVEPLLYTYFMEQVFKPMLTIRYIIKKINARFTFYQLYVFISTWTADIFYLCFLFSLSFIW